MGRFKIFGYTNLMEGRKGEQEVVVTDSENLSSGSTFNESWIIAKHDKIQLSFDILEKLPDGTVNPFFELFKPESVVGLQMLDRQKFTESSTNKEGAFYRLKVVQRSPTFKNENRIYKITCEDYASRVYSRQGEGLSLEMTGTLRQVAEQILGETRKNNLYKNLNRDISELSYFLAPDQKEYGFEYSLPYINCEIPRAKVNSYFRGTSKKPYLSFLPNEHFVKGDKYDISFDLIDARAHQKRGDYDNLDLVFQVSGRGNKRNNITGGFYEIESFGGELAEVSYTGKAMNIKTSFVYDFADDENLFAIYLYLFEQTGKPWKTAEKYTFSVANVKISRNKEHVKVGKNLDELFLNHVDNPLLKNNFTTYFSNYQELVDKYGENGFNLNSISETKMTYSIQNSNLYNSLVQLAELFDGEVKFDYLDNGFFFTKNNSGDYKGFRLDPEINLNSISRPETVEDFATILHIEGSGDVNGVIPSLPKEWRMFFTECYYKWFDSNGNFTLLPTGSTDRFFINYVQGGYQKLAPDVYTLINPKDNYRERVEEINSFAEQLDKIPNFENTVYDIKYFKNIEMINDQSFKRFNDIVYNNIRKLNISLNINSYRYWTVYSSLLTQLQEISFYLGAINTEQKFQNKTNKKELEKYTSSWVSQKNNLNASISAEKELKEEVTKTLGLTPKDDGSFSLDIEPGSFVYNSISLFGFQNAENNAIKDLIEKNSNKIEEKTEERRSLLLKKDDLVSQINSKQTSSFIKESLEVELAGLKNDLRHLETFLGPTAGDIESDAGNGIYYLESFYYSQIYNALPKRKTDLPQSLQSSESLHEVLFNRDSKFNLLNKKEKELAKVLNDFEPFALEARYQNSDVVNPYGLLEQALIAFTTFNRPKVSYAISTINIGAIENYEYYSHPEIGDKILLEDDLYLSYQDEETKYLVVTEYSESLRDPSSLNLGVETDDESELLVRRMLEQSNFVSVGGRSDKENLELQLPQEFIALSEEYIEKEREVLSSELSIADFIIR